MATNNHDNPRAQPTTTPIYVRVIYAYIDPRTGAHVHVHQRGRLVHECVVFVHQKGDNIDNYPVNIPLADVHTQRRVNGELVTKVQRDYSYLHPSTYRHGARLIQMEWVLTVNGQTLAIYDKKSNYDRRIRDLEKVCDRLNWEQWYE